MKFSEFAKKYPHYSRFRFGNEDGYVVFYFNGETYNPFSNGKLIKTFFHFPNDSYKAEDINDFLYGKDYKEEIIAKSE